MEVLRHVESPVFDNFTLNFGASSFISVVFINRDAKRHATYKIQQIKYKAEERGIEVILFARSVDASVERALGVSGFELIRTYLAGTVKINTSSNYRMP